MKNKRFRFTYLVLAVYLFSVVSGSLPPARASASLPAPASSRSSLPAAAQPAPACLFKAGIGMKLYLPLLKRSSGKAAVPENPGGGDRERAAESEPFRIQPQQLAAVSASFSESTAFLYTGSDPRQTGIAPGTIDPQRASVLRGQACTSDGNPLPGVTVSVLDHPEYGSTFTQSDGLFDLAVNGGMVLTLVYQKTGYLPLQRQANALQQDFTWLPEVALIPMDDKVTRIDLSSSDPMQIAQSSKISDGDGSRQASLLIPKDTQAQLLLPGGGLQPVTILNIRATEYTVGAAGPAAMPGELPATSGYTFALEYSVDEAIALHAVGIQFSQPLIHYEQNFLGFPVGMQVPVGYYDRVKAAWIPSNNGVVVKIISITGGLANLDTTGSGTPDNGAALGVTNAERQRLAGLYHAGDSLWRVPILHFTPWDCNWPYGPPPGWDGPKNKPSFPDFPADEPFCESGSKIECENQILGEAVSVAGTPFSLHYQSERVPGRLAAYTLDIPLSGGSIPTGLKAIKLEVQVAGQRSIREFAPAPDLQTRFTWDGKDAYGQVPLGKRPIHIKIGYEYQAVYYEPAQFEQSFGIPTGVTITSNRARQEITMWQEWDAMIGGWDQRSMGLGGWSLDVVHAYDPVGKLLYLGNGARHSSDSLSVGVINTFAGGGNPGGASIGDGGPAGSASLFWPAGLAFGPDGSLYIADSQHQRVRRVDPQGVISTVAGTGTFGYNGDGIPAVSAQLNNPFDVAVGPDGSLYIADRSNQRIRRVGVDGLITTVAGTGVYGYNGDGIPAANAQLNEPYSVAVSPDGSLYIADRSNQRIRRIGTNGMITTLAGSGTWGSSGDGGPASLARLANPTDVTLGPDGSVYITDYANNKIRRVSPDGLITTVAGNGTTGFSGDGGPATSAELYTPIQSVLGSDGALYIADYGNQRIRRVGSDGIITTIAGNDSWGYAGDGGLATKAELSSPEGVIMAPDGSLFIADGFNHRVRRMASIFPGGSNGEILIPSEDGTEVYVFTGSGRHMRTLDARTGSIRYQFAYDSSFRLTSIRDAYGNVTTILRDASGNPTAIQAPYGQQTSLAYNANGYLSGLTDPANAEIRFSYLPGGLLASLTDARGGVHSFTYDSLGRLTKDTGPAGSFKTLDYSATPTGYSVGLRTALGISSLFEITRPAAGDRATLVSYPNGLQAIRATRMDGTQIDQAVDGTISQISLEPDPRWSMQAPLQATTVLMTPGGLQSVYSTGSSVVLTDTNNPFSLVSQTETTGLNGQTYTSHYDAASQTILITSPQGRQETLKINTTGQLAQDQTHGLLAVDYTYDSHGRLTGLSQGVGPEARTITLGYNVNGFLQTYTDALGQIYEYNYDAAGRITSEVFPDGSQIAYSYDGSGNLLAITPPGKTAHSFAYTSSNLLQGYAPPAVNGTGQTLYGYNLDQQLDHLELPDGSIVRFGYDSAGRLSSITTPQGVTSYAYNLTTGALASISSPGGVSLAFTYDSSLLTSQTWSGPVSGAVTSIYDNNYWIVADQVNGANQINYQYDSDGLLAQAGALSIDRSGPSDLITGSTIGSSSATLAYNGFGELTADEAAYNGVSLYHTEYTRDLLGRITQKIESLNGTTTQFDYAYNQAGRLVEVKQDNVSVASYSYDLNGNRTTFKGPGGMISATYDAQDRLVQSGSSTYSYAPNGELLSKTNAGQVTAYQYDTSGNLLGATLPGGTQIVYVVDGQNRRIGKKVNGTLVQGFLYQDSLRPIAELNGSNQVLSRFVYASHDNVPEYLLKGGVTYRIFSDSLGSPRLVVNTATGTVVQRMDYDAFGNVTTDTNPGFQPFGFAGGLYDPEIKLVRFGMRDYDPETGRWTTKDPIRFSGQSANLYAYVGGDPVNYRDPGGMKESAEIKKLRQDARRKHDTSKCPLPHSDEDALLFWPLGEISTFKRVEHNNAGYPNVPAWQK